MLRQSHFIRVFRHRLSYSSSLVLVVTSNEVFLGEMRRDGNWLGLKADYIQAQQGKTFRYYQFYDDHMEIVDGGDLKIRCSRLLSNLSTESVPRHRTNLVTHKHLALSAMFGSTK